SCAGCCAWPGLLCAGEAARNRFLPAKLFLAVNPSGNAHVVGGMLKKENIDDLRIGADRFVGNLDDVTDQLRLPGLGETRCDMTLNVGHSWLPFLLQASNELFVVGIAFDKFGQVLPMLDEVNASSLSDYKEDVV